jgi:sigma-B regulation protein RsbU (phosphoserine phosphatase)
MAPAADPPWLHVVQEILRRSHLWQPDQVADAVNEALSPVGVQATIYQIDHEQVWLRPLPRRDRPAPEPLPVDSSLGGRAFTTVRSLAAGGENGARWWVPIVNGTDRLGVIEFDGPEGENPGLLPDRFEMLAGLIGHLITTATPRGDHLARMRRSRPMPVAAELLLQALPPLTASTDRLVVSAVLEPCYDVGGDGYDYALDDYRPQLVVLDAVGRGLRAALACVVVLAAVRAARRSGHSLHGQARAADAALLEQFPDARFATAVLAELDLRSGVLRYVNAGHPPPLLLRSGRLVRELSGGRRMPLGIEDPCDEIGEESLEPGDHLLIYTDGVTEAHGTSGELFGVDRLVELAERHSADGLPLPETLRRLSQAVLAHQEGPPADDATMLLLQWSPEASARTVPRTQRPPDMPSATGTGKMTT